MNKILGNLIQNAIDELQNESQNNLKIDVDISKERESIVLKVKNSTNSEKECIKSIFDIGYTTKKNHEGLGLPMIQKILLKYNGVIYSEILDNEISFIVRIPVLH
nr:GHKL domain-containing protein [Clostridium gallinarum]